MEERRAVATHQRRFAEAQLSDESDEPIDAAKVANRLREHFCGLDEQVLLLKTAWGGKSMRADFRPAHLKCT